MRRAAETLAARSKQRYVAPTQIAALYAHAGETVQALECLEKAYDVHDTSIVYTLMLPEYEELWDHPRFQDLLRRMNLLE